jgi:hypothetical protein
MRADHAARMGKQEINDNFSSPSVTKNFSSLIRFRLVWIPSGRQQIANYGSSASLGECHFTATCQVKCSHIYILQRLSNKTRPSNNRKFMEVYFRLSHCFSMNVADLLTLLYEIYYAILRHIYSAVLLYSINKIATRRAPNFMAANIPPL